MSVRFVCQPFFCFFVAVDICIKVSIIRGWIDRYTDREIERDGAMDRFRTGFQSSIPTILRMQARKE